MRRILVTGATSGIGRALVEKLAQTEEIICVGRNADALKVLARIPNVVEAVNCDLSDPTACHTLIEGRDIDVLVNNAGVLPSSVGFVDLPTKAIDSMIDVNFRATMHLTQGALRQMQRKGRGHIVFVGSSAGRFPHPGATVYGATKAAMSLFADALRAELAEWRIRVTEVAPGRTRSDLYRQAIGANASGELYDEYEPLEPTDVADAIAYALNVPDNVDVSRIEIMPIGQVAGGGRTIKKSEMKKTIKI